MVAFSHRSPLGVPFSEEDTLDAYADLARTGRLVHLDRQDTDRALQILSRDRALLLAGRRWPSGQPDPAQFVPGDVAAIRYLAAYPLPLTAATLEEISKTIGERDPDLHDAALLSAYSLTQELVDLTSAAPYFLPVNAALAVLRSRPPPPDLADELRLPYPQVLVLFGADLELDPERYPWPEAVVAEAATAGPNEMLGGMVARGGYVTGMVLLADAQGRLREDLLWLVAANPSPTVAFPHSIDRIRGVVRGWRSQAALGPMIDAVAAPRCAGATGRRPEPASTSPTTRPVASGARRCGAACSGDANREAPRWACA